MKLYKYKNIVSLLLVVAFMLPILAKLEHDHEQFVCKAKNEKHFHETHEKCDICTFQYSAFSANINVAELVTEVPETGYYNHYTSVGYTALSDYSFLLRGPPSRLV